MIALFPALGDSLRTLDRAGQRERVTWEFERYGAAFEGASYFSYSPDDHDHGTHWTAVAAPSQAHRVVTGLRIGRYPALHRYTVARVLNFTGVLPALVAKARLGLPFVLQYGYDYDALARLRPRLLRRRGRRLQYALLRAVAFRHASAVIVTTEALVGRLRLRERYPELPVHVIPNGVPLDWFWTRPQGLSGTPKRLIYVGRLSPEKNLVRLVEAVGCLSPRPHLLLVGEGPERARIAEAARQHNVRVFMPGYLQYHIVGEWLRSADAFCLPSFSEGSPKALFEAMASGLPCAVSTGVPGTVEMPVAWFDPDNLDGMIAALRATLVDNGRGPWREPVGQFLGEAARQYVERHHDLEQTLAAEIAVCRQVAEARSEVMA